MQKQPCGMPYKQAWFVFLGKGKIKLLLKIRDVKEKELKEIESALRYDHFLSSKPWRLENFAIR
jgi:hypothetical protein